MKGQSSIEVLLLLCCLVGGIVFLAFSLGVVNLCTRLEDFSTLQADYREVTQQNEAQATELVRLQGSRQRLEETRSSKANAVDVAARDMKTAEAAYDKKAQSAQELDVIATKLEKYDKVQSLEKENRRMEAAIDQKRKILLGLDQAGGPSLDKAITALKNQLEILKHREAELTKYLADQKRGTHQFDPYRDIGGVGELKNPLFVDCRGQEAILLPAKKSYSLSSITNSDLPETFRKHDGVVFIVRPDGFDTFIKVYDQAKKTSIKICYEPVDAGLNISLPGMN
jgi:hypothetical protein